MGATSDPTPSNGQQLDLVPSHKFLVSHDFHFTLIRALKQDLIATLAKICEPSTVYVAYIYKIKIEQ